MLRLLSNSDAQRVESKSVRRAPGEIGSPARRVVNRIVPFLQCRRAALRMHAMAKCNG